MVMFSDVSSVLVDVLLSYLTVAIDEGVTKRDAIARAINHLVVVSRDLQSVCRDHPTFATTMLYERMRLGCGALCYEREGASVHLPLLEVPNAQLSRSEVIHLTTKLAAELKRINTIPCVEDLSRPEHTSKRVWSFFKAYTAIAQHPLLSAQPCANAKCTRLISGEEQCMRASGYMELLTGELVSGDTPTAFFCSRHCYRVWTNEYETLLPYWDVCTSCSTGPLRVESELRAALKRNGQLARALRIIDRGGATYLRPTVVVAIKKAANVDVSLLYASSLLAPLKTGAALAGTRVGWRKNAWLLKKAINNIRRVRLPTHVVTELHSEERLTSNLQSRAKTIF